MITLAAGAIVGCSTTEQLVYSSLYSVETEVVEDIRGDFRRERMLIYKDVEMFEQVMLTYTKARPVGSPDVRTDWIGIWYDGQGWHFYEGLVLQTNDMTVELTDSDPNRQTISGGRVVEHLVLPVSDELRESLLGSSRLRFQLISRYHNDPVSIPDDGVHAIQRFVAE